MAAIRRALAAGTRDAAAMVKRMTWRRWALAVLALAGIVAVWLLTTDIVQVWPVRNTLQYQLTRWWWRVAGPPQTGSGGGTVTGVVRDRAGAPLAGARVLVTRWDGSAYEAQADGQGAYRLLGVPAGTYTAVAGAPGHESTELGRVRVGGGGEHRLDARLTREQAQTLPRPQVMLWGQTRVRSELPIAAEATRLEVRRAGFPVPGRSESPVDGDRVFLYVPDVSQISRVPLLLTVYPGPSEQWESASIPLAAAGYAVLAVGPSYSFELERDVTQLAGLLNAQLEGDSGPIPSLNMSRIAVLGGSYSALHVQRLLQRLHGTEVRVRAAVLMGPPTDLFDMRRRLEDRTFVPPFGLDQALVALGFPDREALRYWRYSGAYHVRPGLPPHLLVHSRSDDVVPYQQSELLARTLTEVGVPRTLHLLDGGSHYLLSNEADARPIYELTLRFLKEHVG